MYNYRKLSDFELASLLTQDDSLAFVEIYERYKTILYIHAYKKIANREEVQDIIQDVFTKLWLTRASSNFTNLSGYLYVAVRNGVFDHISHMQVKERYRSSFQGFSQNGQVIADHLIREKQLTEIIEKEIALLPPRMREVFELSRKEHLSHREIADRLELSEKTVDRQISNALKILRTKMGAIAFMAILAEISKFN